MIRWGVALIVLGMLWPISPPVQFWVGIGLCAIGGAMTMRGVLDRYGGR